VTWATWAALPVLVEPAGPALIKRRLVIGVVQNVFHQSDRSLMIPSPVLFKFLQP